jgi:hypothetical protein
LPGCASISFSTRNWFHGFVFIIVTSVIWPVKVDGNVTILCWTVIKCIKALSLQIALKVLHL